MPRAVFESGTPILIDSEPIIGTALLLQPLELDPHEQRCVVSTNLALLIGAAGDSATALVVGLLLSRQFLQPLSELTRAITATHMGDLDQHVAIRSNDELGALAQTLALLVRDTGASIALDDLPRTSDRFYRSSVVIIR